jgi:hypothetical protein
MMKIDWERVEKLQTREWKENPKHHDVDAIKASMRKYGYTIPVAMDETSGKLVAGHGRLMTVVSIRDAGETIPKRLMQGHEYAGRGVCPFCDLPKQHDCHTEEARGSWFMPVLRGLDFDDEQQAEEYLVADNRLVELGGWDDSKLAALTSRIAERGDEALKATGFNSGDIDAIIQDISASEKKGKTPQEKLDTFEHAEIKQIVLYLKGEDYDETLQRLMSVIDHYSVEDNTSAVMKLLDFWEQEMSKNVESGALDNGAVAYLANA